MKKIVLVLALVLASSFNAIKAQNVGNGIDFEVYITDPTEDYEPFQKSPIVVPSVSLDDHTLYFETSCDGYMLRLLDANDNVVYSTIIPTGTTSIVLPSSLSGEYEIQIIQGNLCFYGYITL